MAENLLDEIGPEVLGLLMQQQPARTRGGLLPVDYPGGEDEARSRLYGLPYGTSMEAYSEGKQGTKFNRASMDEVAAGYNRDEVAEGKPAQITPDVASLLHKSWLAARRSAVAQLGFDPAHTALSKDKRVLPFAGLTYPSGDKKMWADTKNPSAIVHESIHRGLQMLEERGLINKLSYRENELVTRALMLRHFGDVEASETGGQRHEEIDEAEKTVNPRFLDHVEGLAARYLADKKPMGPR